MMISQINFFPFCGEKITDHNFEHPQCNKCERCFTCELREHEKDLENEIIRLMDRLESMR